MASHAMYSAPRSWRKTAELRSTSHCTVIRLHVKQWLRRISEQFIPLLQVMQFWKKAERVMVYKRQSQLDARKKEAMDKHLSFLVHICPHGCWQVISSRLQTMLCRRRINLQSLGFAVHIGVYPFVTIKGEERLTQHTHLQVDQTQKYSSLLAQRLGVPGEEVLALPAPQPTPAAAQSQPDLSLKASKPQASVKAEEAGTGADGMPARDEDMGEPEGAAGSLEAIKTEPNQVCFVFTSPLHLLGTFPCFWIAISYFGHLHAQRYSLCAVRDRQGPCNDRQVRWGRW